jgi:hypothetical protein
MEPSTLTLRGFITAADLPRAEQEWPGLQAFFVRLPPEQRPATFLDLVWRFERAAVRREGERADRVCF